jgi:hypothetical protein
VVAHDKVEKVTEMDSANSKGSEVMGEDATKHSIPISSEDASI